MRGLGTTTTTTPAENKVISYLICKDAQFELRIVSGMFLDNQLEVGSCVSPASDSINSIYVPDIILRKIKVSLGSQQTFPQHPQLRLRLTRGGFCRLRVANIMLKCSVIHH